jgi:rhodanese-related sulfurtransferase
MTRLHRGLVTAATLLAGGAAVIDHIAPAPHAVPAVSAIELGERIMEGDTMLRVYDLRSSAEYQQFHIPGARSAAVEAIEPGELDIIVYAGNDGTAAQTAAALHAQHGSRVRYLEGGLHAWITRVHEPRLAIDATPAEQAEFPRAARLSRFFGGTPRADVPRAEILRDETAATSTAVQNLRRRGC